MAKAQAPQELESEYQYHRREWRVERVGWMGMLVFVVAACLGFFGEGPVSDRTIGEPKSAMLEYERFIRYASPTTLELRIPESRSRSVDIDVNEAYLRDFEITSIAPEPSATQLVGDRLRFTFEVAQAPATVKLRITPRKIGAKHGTLAVSGTPISFGQFVYP